LVLIPTAWLAVVFFALTMCHLAARSDDSHAVALVERIATSSPAEQEAVSAAVAAKRLRLDPRRRAYRDTG
jgi:hypothetical protein